MKKILTRFRKLMVSFKKVGKKIVPDEAKQMLSRIAEEGYETAHDVLFPRHDGRLEKLHYGPVLPA